MQHAYNIHVIQMHTTYMHICNIHVIYIHATYIHATCMQHGAGAGRQRQGGKEAHSRAQTTAAQSTFTIARHLARERRERQLLHAGPSAGQHRCAGASAGTAL